jgi:predicted site-specific integrase-resolvase
MNEVSKSDNNQSNNKNKMKVALYVRVSTKDQNLKMQKDALIDKADREGWEYEF